jgi:hypothetical protein
MSKPRELLIGFSLDGKPNRIFEAESKFVFGDDNAAQYILATPVAKAAERMRELLEWVRAIQNADNFEAAWKIAVERTLKLLAEIEREEGKDDE